MPQLKVLPEKERKFSRGFRGKTRILIDTSSFIGFIGVYLRLSAVEIRFPDFLLKTLKTT